MRTSTRLWIALVQLIWIRARTWLLALIVLLATCGVELLQLSQQAWLVALRATFLGRMVLGANGGFDPLDFLHYLIGSGLGALLCHRLGLRAGRGAVVSRGRAGSG